MIKFAVITMVCLLGLKMVASMPVADHQAGHEPLPVVSVEEKVPAEIALKAADVPQSNAPAESEEIKPTEAPAAVNAPARSSEEVEPVEPKKDEPELPKAAVKEVQIQPKSSEEQIDSVEKEEPKVLAAEAEKKQEQEPLNQAASEAKESVQPAPQPAEIPAEKKPVSFFNLRWSNSLSWELKIFFNQNCVFYLIVF